MLILILMQCLVCLCLYWIPLVDGLSVGKKEDSWRKKQTPDSKEVRLSASIQVHLAKFLIHPVDPVRVWVLMDPTHSDSLGSY